MLRRAGYIQLIQQLCHCLVINRMQQIGRYFAKRYQHEIPLVRLDVRNPERFIGYDDVVIENNIKVERPRPPSHRADTLGFFFDFKKQLE